MLTGVHWRVQSWSFLVLAVFGDSRKYHSIANHAKRVDEALDATLVSYSRHRIQPIGRRESTKPQNPDPKKLNCDFVILSE